MHLQKHLKHQLISEHYFLSFLRKFTGLVLSRLQFIFLPMTKCSGLKWSLQSIMSNLGSSSNLFYFKDVTMCRKGQTIWNSLQGATFPAYRISLIAARKNIQGKAETISKKLISLPPPPTWSPLYLSGTYTLVFRINLAPRLLFWRKILTFGES